MTQVNKNHYQFEKYSGTDRFSSYYYQLREALNCNPKNVLEIGVGDRMFGNYIRENTDIAYTSCDIAEDLNPDIIGSITDIPLEDDSFDVVCAFEVLEHIPFESFEKALMELKRVSRGGVIISVPHFGPPIKFSLKIPFLPEIQFAWKIPYPREHVFNGEHYWEIGKKGFSPRRIRGILQKHFIVRKEFVPFENQYHHFFVLDNNHD